MDIWSLGCCIVQMATGRRPWSTLENEWSVMYHVVTGHPPLPDTSQLSSPGIDFLKKCFVRDPKKRPSAEELLKHPWITNHLERCIDESQLPLSQEGANGDHLATNNNNESWSAADDPHGNEIPPIMRSIDSNGSLEHPLVRSIPNSLAIDGMVRSIPNSLSVDALVRSIPNSLALDGMAASHENGAQAQAYFQSIAEQHAKDAQWEANDTPSS